MASFSRQTMNNSIGKGLPTSILMGTGLMRSYCERGVLAVIRLDLPNESSCRLLEPDALNHLVFL